jgi:hypothetical protein
MRQLNAMNPDQTVTIGRRTRSTFGSPERRGLPGVLPALEPVTVPLAGAAAYEDQRLQAQKAPSAVTTKRKLSSR